MPAVKEYYAFVSCDETRVKLGAFAWLSLACLALETLVRSHTSPRLPAPMQLQRALTRARAPTARLQGWRRRIPWRRGHAARRACVLDARAIGALRRMAGVGGAHVCAGATDAAATDKTLTS